MNIQCDKCGLDITYTNNFYMINNNLWEKYNNDADLLCIKCLEKNMGRKLQVGDLTICPANKEFLINKILNKLYWINIK